MNVLLIDNIDSFTWNLAQQIQALGASCVVVRHDEISIEEIRKKNPDRIVISPGPGSPKDAKISLDVLRELSGCIPILGVCLGHQCMAHVFGGASFVGHAPSPMHGKTSEVQHQGDGLFKRIPSPFTVARYHSLIVKKLPKDFVLTAWSKEGGKKIIMGMRHEKKPLFGVQFHPESFMTEYGSLLIQNFLLGQW